MRKLLLASVCLIVGLATLPAMAADPAAVASTPATSRFWVGADYLLWTVKGDKLPALVTTSPAGTPQAQAGVLGAPGTTVLFGDSRVNDGWRSGGRVQVGYWLDDRRTSGIEGSFFQLEDESTRFKASSGGDPILARPFLNVTTTLQDSSLIAFPGVGTGEVSVNETSHLLGAGLLYRQELCAGSLGRISGLLGYRFLRATDRLRISTSQPLAGSNIPPFALAVTDQFDTDNNFHGVDLGLTGESSRGPWTFEWLARVAVGATVSAVRIDGDTTINGIPALGGLLALPTNIGRFHDNHFAVVPEVGITLGYQVAPNLRIRAGYSFLYWTDVLRPGGVIDTSINPSQLPPGTLSGPSRPRPQLDRSDLWAHGLVVGLVLSF